MKLMKSLMVLAFAACFSQQAHADVGNVIAACPEKAGGIYYAYDVAKDSIPPVPDGYRPVYVSHYGRHGSRWPVNPKTYKIASDFFQEQQLYENLTPVGKDMWKLVARCAGNAQGHLGELTDLGRRQHHAIAGRLRAACPDLFSDGKVVARSSVEPRCIMSMMAFCDRLEEEEGHPRISKHASPGDMDFIHHNTAEAKLNTGEDAPWMWGFHHYRDSVSRAPKAAARLFKRVPDTDSLQTFMRAVYDIAISVQDIDGLEADMLSLFDADELAGLWKASNYMQYAANARSPESLSSGPESVKPLLREITMRADTMLASDDVSVDLRFGHDTDLLRLVSLIEVGGLGVESDDVEEVADKWRNFEISPMGANLQLFFYRNEEGNIIVLPRLNEQPVGIGELPEAFPGYYDWELLKHFFDSL